MDVWLNRWTQKKNYERLQKALDSVMSIREMTQVEQGDGSGFSGQSYIRLDVESLLKIESDMK